MRRERVVKVGDLFRDFLKSSGLDEGILRMRIFEAWDEVVGKRYAEYTLEKFFKDGRLFCKISSSPARNHLFMERLNIVKKMNEKLGEEIVKVLILK
ncbi:MAG: hypothetical protein A2X17_06700 [Bacteroidetes bacterium GWF2_41_61]|jgi:hypothetical protein|nr:MAG: hypothetical protein A2X20_07835 [Bacteroidetes bacterium GWE2_40_15]OFY36111.1 MAG: hypothetical protein A2X17_06700 [Bacteroidetes bacterium GWF2_41_61]OFY88328.1 MAG: hypothetical protein A2266_07820 [Bacteroidetes bacterium RIFOXYA12_FULL_40_10]HBG23737.1 DUF721 domain-containing protein [Rikenellaceae bacterium]HBZ26014.1 DUF721 domain-containing protein [Rikenellaceae bacterium]